MQAVIVIGTTEEIAALSMELKERQMQNAKRFLPIDSIMDSIRRSTEDIGENGSLHNGNQETV